MRSAFVIVIAYLLGSVPFGYLIVRLRQGADIRETGSGGTGATNVSRRAGKAAGVVTLLLDALKGAAAVMIASHVVNGVLFGSVNWWIAGAAVAVVIGHMFPVWLGFRGGKGVATGVGVFLFLAPVALAFSAVIFVAVVWPTRYVSLGSVLAALSIPLFVLLQHSFSRAFEPMLPIIFAAVVIATLIVFAHRQNIGRLIQGTENRFS